MNKTHKQTIGQSQSWKDIFNVDKITPIHIDVIRSSQKRYSQKLAQRRQFDSFMREHNRDFVQRESASN